jgi:hypothetical protein
MQRMVWFWSNHFCVSADKEGVRAICGAYEREAIRAHVLGRFSDMLLAVESHPAMLIYLDNARSLGPDSLDGIRRRRGLNANLAREILELHTLGVRGRCSLKCWRRSPCPKRGRPCCVRKAGRKRSRSYSWRPSFNVDDASWRHRSRGVLPRGAAVEALARLPFTALERAVRSGRWRRR